MQVFKIVPTVQQYDWGKVGTSSKVAIFALSAGISDFHVDESKPYAEVSVCGDKYHALLPTSRSRKLWMGTHPKSPSLVSSSGETLATYLSKNKSLIGEKVAQKFSTEDGNLPFLFKVLAIEKALSIQSHPDKVTAEKLHVQHPDIYRGRPTLLPPHWDKYRCLASQTRTISPRWRSPSRPSPPFVAFSHSKTSLHTSIKCLNYRN
jgi:mannose-6-phosphate isomerase